METIHAWFERHVQQTPDGNAVICGNQSLTYHALNNRANSLAVELQKLHVKPDMQIALCLERSIEQITAMVAILKAGGAYVPLDPSQPIERLNMILRDVPILIITANEQALFDDYHGTLIVVTQESNAGPTTCLHRIRRLGLGPTIAHTTAVPVDPILANVSSLVTPQNLAYVIYTSGTTGTPKGVLIEHQTVVNFCQWYGHFTSAYPGQRIDWSGNYIFDMAVATSIAPLMLGMTIVMCADEVKKNPSTYLHYLSVNNINFIKLSPSYFKALVLEIADQSIELPHLQTIVLGGERLLTADCLAWLERYPEHIIFNEYGPTEATVAVTQQKICKENIHLFQTYIPIGLPASHVQCYLLNDKNERLITGDTGEMHIGGASLARGYLNQPILTAEKFIPCPFQTEQGGRLYKTGDLCRQLSNGAIEFIGRIDQQMKFHGYRIEPGEIEVCLRRHPSIKDALVVVCEEEHLVAYCILKQNHLNPSYTQMRKYLQQHLPDYMIPNNFVKLDYFPLTANGKLDHRSLPLPSLSGSQHYVAPKTRLEKKLAAIWSSELGIHLIGINDNFFELGGHSLNAARIVAEIRKNLKCNLNINDFYHAETIAALAAAYFTHVPAKAEMDLRLHKDDKIAKLSAISKPLGDFQLFLWMLKTFEPNARKLNIVSRKRWQGLMDKGALNAAFGAILKRHDIFCYRTKTFFPAQYQTAPGEFSITETSITEYSRQESEEMLVTSFSQLIHFNDWSKQHHQIIAKIFYLHEGAMELQICLPHLISDNASLDIFWRDLSKFYHAYLITKSLDVEKATSFNEYIIHENKIIETNFEQNCLFWKNYLHNTRLFIFPSDQIVQNMQAKQLSYSTYQEIPSQTLSDLEQYCAMHQIGLNAVLCAAVGLALKNLVPIQPNNRPILMNVVKSTRNDKAWDETIGCFIRLDPIKVDICKHDTLLPVAKQIHQTMIENANQMQASTILKLAHIRTKNSNKKRYYLLKLFIGVYAKILQWFNLNYNALQFIAKLSWFNQKNEYIICVNLRHNFTSPLNKNENLHWQGQEEKSIQMYQYDLENFDNVCDVSFLRDDDQKTPYAVISGNLKPNFRKRIAEEIMAVLSQRTKDEVISI